jgi:hypothetical protein
VLLPLSAKDLWPINSSHPLSNYVAIGKTNHITVFVIPGLTRNPLLYQSVTLLDAGSVIPDLIRDRHGIRHPGLDPGPA